jgi:uncharacterized protein
LETITMLGWFDPMYLVFLAPGLLLAMWAQARVSMAYSEGSQIESASGITGAQAAAAIMRAEGVHGVEIEPVEGHLTDHYDPRHKVLRLSHGNYAGSSLAALGVAAHEAGHAIQDAHGYSPLVIRNLMVPVAGFGSNASFLVMIAGALLQMTGLILLGIILFGTTVAFQLVNLPVEFDASRRARAALAMTGMIHPEEDRTVGKVLNAAAWTYVAATLTSVLTLLYYLYRFGLLGGSSRDD